MEVPELITSVSCLRAALPNDARAAERFWHDVRNQGAPLVENIPGDPSTVLVTFVLRGSAELRNPVVFASVFPDNDPVKQRLLHLPGSDVWFRTYRFRCDLPILYELSDDGAEKLRRDPLNDKYIDGPMGGSIVILPGVRNIEWSKKRPVAEGKQEIVRFRSKRLDNERILRVYLPAGFVRGNQYDMLVMLDEHVYSGPVPLITILDNLIAEKRIRPTVAVLVSSTDRASELSCSPEFVAMVSTELLPWVEQRYALKRNRDRTTIAGSSLGGLAAACAGWYQSIAFANVISLSGSFRWRPPTESEPEWFARQIATSSLLSVRFIISVGSHETGTPSEPANPSLLTANRHLRDVLRAKGYALFYEEFAGAHEPLSWRTAIVDGLVAAQK